MAEHPKPELPEQIACEICMKEVPKSEALNAEGAEYVLYFCGLDCYRKWSGEQPDQTDDASAAGKPHVHTAGEP